MPLTGIDPDGDGVTLLGQDAAPGQGPDHRPGRRLARVPGAPRASSGTDTFTLRGGGLGRAARRRDVRVGIAARPTDARLRSWPATTRSPCAPGQSVEVRVLANDVDTSGGELTLDPALTEGRACRRARRGPAGRGAGARRAGHVQIVYTATERPRRAGQRRADGDWSTDAPILAPVAQDVVVPATETINRISVEVDVLAVAQNPSGPLSDLQVSVDPSARGHRDGDPERQGGRHARGQAADPALPADQHLPGGGRRQVLRLHHRARPRGLPAGAPPGAPELVVLAGSRCPSRSRSRSRSRRGAPCGSWTLPA